MDASVLINLIHGNRLPLLGALQGFAFVVPEQAVEEISNPDQAALLSEALDHGHLRRESSTDPAELTAYTELRKVVGKGEAACLAMAQGRGWMVACDERGRFLREVRDRLGEGHVVNTPGLILLAIRRGIMTVAEADSLKALLETRRFKMSFGSFRDLLEGPSGMHSSRLECMSLTYDVWPDDTSTWPATCMSDVPMLPNLDEGG